MSAAVVVLEAPKHRRAPRHVVTSLARIEAGRILRHPAFLLGVLGTTITLLQERGGDMQRSWMLSGQAFATLGVMTFLVGFLNAARVHRDGAGELYEALPGSAAARTGAILLSLVAAAGVAALMTAVAWLLAVGPDGQITIDLQAISPSLLEPLQVPLIVAGFGALGVCFGRWTPQPALAPLLTIAIWVGPIAWSIPWVVMGTSPQLFGDDWLIGPPGWHLVFLAGVIATASSLALLRDTRGRAAVIAAAAGVLALALGLVLQV